MKGEYLTLPIIKNFDHGQDPIGTVEILMSELPHTPDFFFVLGYRVAIGELPYQPLCVSIVIDRSILFDVLETSRTAGARE